MAASTSSNSASAAEEPLVRESDGAQDATVDKLDTNSGEPDAGAPAETLLNLTILLPGDGGSKMQVMVSSQEQVHEVRQSIIDLPAAFQFTCFHFEYEGRRINDFIPISDIPNITTEPEFRLVEDPYNEKEARIHLVRIRELIGAAGDRPDASQGALAGSSLYETVTQSTSTRLSTGEEVLPLSGYDFESTPSLSSLIPQPPEQAPKTVKSLALSPWNPPPIHLRQRGHLLYLLVTTNEGEQFHITSHVSGFFVNKSSNAKFDPSPRATPSAHSAHSLFSLLDLVSASFGQTFRQLQDYTNQRDPLTTFQISNAIPSKPWVVPPPSSAACVHLADPARCQETYLLSGVDNTDTLRDWNEEFQSAKELPKDTVQDRVFRERLLSKLFADYNDAATKGAIMVAKGEISPLNPTEATDAQIFVYNNIFFSFGADGVGTFTSEGGDEAARVATGKDVAGVKRVNQLDIDGLFTPATVVIDYFGRRLVAQSIVPGIFKQREPGENQIDYGAVDGRDVVAADDRFVAGFSQLAKAWKAKKHPVWDRDGKRFDLEASVETKGLLGTDGRKYVLDLYRITPLDIAWMETTDTDCFKDNRYPHRMTVLRPELVDSFARYRMKQWVDGEMAKRKSGTGNQAASVQDGEDMAQQPQLNLADFKFGLNPDVFSGQTPQTSEEIVEWQSDEAEVREACQYLREQAIPGLLKELSDSDISFPMDGPSLSRLLHKRGINVRYLGVIATLSDGSRLHCMRSLAVRDMIARAFKHVASLYMRRIATPMLPSCVSHLLNCLIGSSFNSEPQPHIDPSMKILYADADWSFSEVTPASLRAQIEKQVAMRFRFALGPDWMQLKSPVHLLRDICLRLGIQLQVKNFAFAAGEGLAQANGSISNSQDAPHSNGELKKKKKKNKDTLPSSASGITKGPITTFVPDDIVDIVPLVKDSCPRSTLAEEALEAGRISIIQNQKKLGQELLLESLSLHEQIYGILHPEVARVYNSLSMLYYQLDDKEAAVELARKAIIVSERTVGIDSAETLLNYLNLSLFLHQTGDSKGALIYSRHALTLWNLIYGRDHPDSITTINNAAVMLQHLKAYHESRLWFEEALRVCATVFGKQSVNAATLLFQLAQALALDHDSKAAVNSMRESYNIFLSKLGPDDKNTKEAESWLVQLTQNAVSIAKHAKDVQARRVRNGIRFTGSTPGAPNSASPAERIAPASQMDSRSIDELIKFIEGGDKKAKTPKKRSGRANPKARGRGGFEPSV